MTLGIVLASLLASNASGKALVRTQPGTMVASPGAKVVNLIPNGQRSNFTGWGKLGSGGASTQPVVTADQFIAPDGSNTADKIDQKAASGVGAFTALVSPDIAFVSGQPYSFSVWAQTASGTLDTYIYCFSSTWFALSRITITTTLQRFSSSGTAPGSSTQRCYIGADLTAGSGMSAISAGTFYAWGAQIENRSNPSPTTVPDR